MYALLRRNRTCLFTQWNFVYSFADCTLYVQCTLFSSICVYLFDCLFFLQAIAERKNLLGQFRLWKKQKRKVFVRQHFFKYKEELKSFHPLSFPIFAFHRFLPTYNYLLLKISMFNCLSCLCSIILLLKSTFMLSFLSINTVCTMHMWSSFILMG